MATATITETSDAVTSQPTLKRCRRRTKPRLFAIVAVDKFLGSPFVSEVTEFPRGIVALYANHPSRKVFPIDFEDDPLFTLPTEGGQLGPLYAIVANCPKGDELRFLRRMMDDPETHLKPYSPTDKLQVVEVPPSWSAF